MIDDRYLDSPIGILSRRDFMRLTGLSLAGAAVGCAVNPVTGQNQFMIISQSDEIQVDRQYAPQQFSSDYGRSQDATLSTYISEVGRRLVPHTHRRDMPYNFQVVNAAYVNAYAFPGGSIAATRGILLKLRNEDELAALLGHELGHVNARHTAQQMSKGTLTSLLLAGVQIGIGASGYKEYADLAGQLGMLGAGMLLASYSRDNEREADALGNRYMVSAGYSTTGFVGLMEMLNTLHREKPGYADVLFSTHPMSTERYETARRDAAGQYAATQNKPLQRQRYMDQTARLRARKDAIEAFQKGEELMAKKQYAQAEEILQRGLKQTPDDYAGLVMMAKCQISQDKFSQAQPYAEKAKRAYPQEAQGYHVSGFALLKQNRFEPAYQDFDRCERLLPGNPSVVFFKGYAQEGMGHREQAATAYQKYLQQVQEGEMAQHAYQRLQEWGYLQG